MFMDEIDRLQKKLLQKIILDYPGIGILDRLEIKPEVVPAKGHQFILVPNDESVSGWLQAFRATQEQIADQEGTYLPPLETEFVETQGQEELSTPSDEEPVTKLHSDEPSENLSDRLKMYENEFVPSHGPSDRQTPAAEPYKV